MGVYIFRGLNVSPDSLILQATNPGEGLPSKRSKISAMLGKRSRPIQRTQSKIFHLMTTDINLTEKLLQPFFSAPRLFIGLANNPPKPYYDYNDGSRSPTSPLDAAPCFGAAVNKPKAVGLGILAALTDDAGADENKCKGNVVSPKNSISKMFCCSSSESVPIPVGRGAAMKEEEREDSLEFSESYTCVTTHGPASVTKQIYFDEEEFREPKRKAAAVFEASSFNEEPCFPVADFLSCCFLCRRPLAPGKDIFMYRGDRAFCSVECRYQQIVSDEKKERCASASTIKKATAISVPQQRSGCYQPKQLAMAAA